MSSIWLTIVIYMIISKTPWVLIINITNKFLTSRKLIATEEWMNGHHEYLLINIPGKIYVVVNRAKGE